MKMETMLKAYQVTDTKISTKACYANQDALKMLLNFLGTKLSLDASSNDTCRLTTDAFGAANEFISKYGSIEAVKHIKEMNSKLFKDESNQYPVTQVYIRMESPTVEWIPITKNQKYAYADCSDKAMLISHCPSSFCASVCDIISKKLNELEGVNVTNNAFDIIMDDGRIEFISSTESNEISYTFMAEISGSSAQTNFMKDAIVSDIQNDGSNLLSLISEKLQLC